MRTIFVVLSILILGSLQSFAQDATVQVVGQATAIDSDAIDVNGKRLFLFGIEAFESKQTCILNGRVWHCGQIAHRELEIIVAEGEVSCVRRKEVDRKRMRFPWATCKIGEMDIAEAMVRRGMAFAQREQSKDYIAAEEEAKANLTGVWKSNFLTPWEYRDRLRGM